ncbi:MAG: 4-(cytidine 5'-diphospho)-2-C-methyl-D-erythritol kinase [Rikenellaceae bacterium]|jgi:4-diphosphocytidyl-2-C-methyl-D-erythritol kinase|nr:4-(cytidine 5'-diphospho)-2-C-methyl-D-erythritol kinase [Rikenellaceae bacterium]
MLLFPNCKINIGLNVLRRRPDGYHDIETLMFPVRGLCDSVELVRSRGRGVEFGQSGLTVDCPVERNICVAAYELMRRQYGIGGIKMHLHKAIPFGAGLGGGSADASFVLKGLSELFGLGLADETLERLAAELGSDTAFFVRNRPALCSGRGEIMAPFDATELTDKYLIIIKPDVAVPTSEAYRALVPAPASPLAETLNKSITSWRTELKNDFEPAIFARHPVLGKIKRQLYDMGALYASMSGSGAAIYGIFDSEPDAVALQSGYFIHTERVFSEK